MKCLMLNGIEVIEPLANVELTTPREWEDLLDLLPNLGDCVDATRYNLNIIEDDGDWTRIYKYYRLKEGEMADLIEALNKIGLDDASAPDFKDNLYEFVVALEMGKAKKYLADGNWRKWRDALEIHKESFEDFLFDRFCERYAIPASARGLLDKTVIADNLRDEFEKLGYKEIVVDKRLCTARYKWDI